LHQLANEGIDLWLGKDRQFEPVQEARSRWTQGKPLGV
jgi:hypothetical protein